MLVGVSLNQNMYNLLPLNNDLVRNRQQLIQQMTYWSMMHIQNP